MDKRKLLLRVFCILVALSTFVSSLIFSINKKSNSTLSPPLSFSILIDPGHGGIDSGAIGVKTGNKESDLNLDLSFLLQKYLTKSNLAVTLTRQNQDGLYGSYTDGFKKRDMQKRKEIIQNQNPDLVVSIHMNKFPLSTRRGAQVCYQKGDDISQTLATLVQESLNTYINIPILGRSFEPISGDYYVCKIKKPAIIVECGFLSNEQDDLLLSQKSHRTKVAYTIYNGILSYLIKESIFIPEYDK